MFKFIKSILKTIIKKNDKKIEERKKKLYLSAINEDLIDKLNAKDGANKENEFKKYEGLKISHVPKGTKAPAT